MIKTQGSIIIACICLAGSTFAQEATTLGGRTEVSAQTTATVQSPTILRLGQIQVKDISGQQLGTLEDVVVSPQGCIDMGVVSLGGTRLVPVPWQVVRTEQSTIGAAGVAAPMIVTLHVDQARLAQAPAVDRAQLRTQLSQPAFTQQINTFFGVRATGINPANQTSATASTNLYGARTNQFGTQTNMFPTGRTNLFRSPTNTFPPGRLPPGQTPGAIPGRPDPGFQSPGTSPTPPGTPGTTPGVTDPNRPSPTPGTPRQPGTGTTP
jgi:hypothetical protein